MAHMSEQNGSGKYKMWKDGCGHLGWGTRLGLLSVIGAMWLLAVDIARVQAAPFAYITNQRSGTVSVIDTATNVITATVPVGSTSISFHCIVSIYAESASKFFQR